MTQSAIYKHWKILKDGSLKHIGNGYEIDIEWILGAVNKAVTPEKHLSPKNWATQDVIDEVIHYRKSKMN